MSDQELLVAVVVGGIALIIIVRFFQYILAIGIIAAGVGVVLCSQDGADCKLPDLGSQQPWFPGTESSEWNARDAAIDAVYKHVRGKTYLDNSSNRIERRVPCSRYDAERDRTGLKCRGHGGRGYGFKTEVSYSRDPVPRACPIPPHRSSTAWRVNTLEPRRWMVSNPSGRWVVALDGAGYHVNSHQPC